MILDLRSLFLQHGVSTRGVIHIGAHEGHELDTYLALGFRRILFVEANPAVFIRLKQRIAGHPHVTAVQCAITDACGEISLHLMSNDQCSSVLPLGTHAEIYPDIVPVGIIKVRSLTLDALLMELRLHPAEFNFINLDIQGGEWLALSGAIGLLPFIDAISTEVNLAELYHGCRLLSDMDSLLAGHKFQRRELATPFHPTWGDAFYVKDNGLITMSSIGRNGRFGNQLFQYAYLKFAAVTSGLRIETPDWIGQRLFGIHDLPVSGASECDISGFFQDMAHYRHCPQLFRALYRPAPAILAHVQPMLDQLRKRGHTIIGLHLRRGDYGGGYFFVAPSQWYLDWLRPIWKRLHKPVLFVASDEPDKVVKDFARFNPVTDDDLGENIAGAEFYPDFFLLTQCDLLAISNSSFSFAAALLNERAKVFMRPHPSGKLVEFEPWESPVLLTDWTKPVD